MRVLVVEDSRTLADALAEGLQDEGMAVDVAYDGLEAARKLDLIDYDVVVLDRDLPGVHGDTVCRMITEREKPAMVLMLTASGTAAERVSGLSLGADDYLSKPFHLPELVLRVRALARRRPTVQARIFKAAGIELDPLHHTATRDGRRLDLSAKEFAVLEALMRAQHAVLSAEALFARVWDENVDPFSNTVQVTISRLRRKLGEPQAIETVTSVGYRIAESPEGDPFTTLRPCKRGALGVDHGFRGSAEPRGQSSVRCLASQHSSTMAPGPDGPLSRRVIVHGLVQAVGFRVSAAQAAHALGVAGWVRNRPDGTVEAVFEGPHDAVASMVEWCRRGPRGAVVDDVEVHEEAHEGLTGFEIR